MLKLLQRLSYSYALLLLGTWAAMALGDIVFTAPAASAGWFLLGLPLPLLPVLWLLTLRNKNRRAVGLWLYALVFVPYAILLPLIVTWTLHDLRTGNGYRLVYEHNLGEREQLVIYRSPDNGAFGGDLLVAATVRPLFLGLEQRRFLPGVIQRVPEADSNYVAVGDRRIPVPKDKVLYSRGELRLD